MRAQEFRHPSFPAAARPAAENARAQFLLKGHSGASVVLCTEGSASIVRKTAGVPAQNERLMRQSARQRELSNLGLRFPRVLREATDAQGLAFFEMEYIPAQTVAATLRDAAAFDPSLLEAALERVLAFFRMSAAEALPSSLFHDKIAQIEAACGEKVRPLARRLRGLDWSTIPSSLSHGDLTLENILLCPSRGIVFIDCDDRFASSWWLDAAKLCQDTMGHWCLRELYLQEGGAWLNAVQRLDRLTQAVFATADRLDPRLRASLPQMAALHLLRALPYTQDKRIADFILQRADHVLGDTA